MRTSEYVSAGHPDKIADFISEFILDKYLEKDPNVKYAVEVQIKDRYVTLAGEITSSFKPSRRTITRWVRAAIDDLGYTKEYKKRWGKENTICGDDVKVTCHISRQSPDIAQGVEEKNGWGDQGIYFGYAESNEKSYMLPLDYYLARDLGQRLYYTARQYPEMGLGIDIKTQITLKNDDTTMDIIIAIPTLYETTSDDFVWQIIEEFLEQTWDDFGISIDTITINGTGKYQIHGPVGDCGTTGRKLVVNFYGGNCPIGGGCPWTKDPSKSDLTLNLYARDIAIKELVRYNAERPYGHHSICQLSSCIGQSKVGISIRIYNENNSQIFEKHYYRDISPNELIKIYGLKNPIYKKLLYSDLKYDSEWDGYYPE